MKVMPMKRTGVEELQRRGLEGLKREVDLVERERARATPGGRRPPVAPPVGAPSEPNGGRRP